MKQLFYGWWIVISCVFISLWAGGIFFGITAFIKPIAEEFTWTYLVISLAASMRSVEMGLLAPLAGFLADRFGPRKVTFVGGLVGGAGLLLLSRTNSLAVFYIAFIVFSMGFSGLGQAVTTTAVANWFHKKIGKATGFALAGYGAGGLLLPLIAWLTIHYGWRLSVIILGLGTLLIVLPLSLLLRHKPEQYGYWSDGEKPNTPLHSGNTGQSALPAEADLSARQALKTKAFWVLAFTFAIQFIVVQAVTLHIMPYGASVHLSDSTSALVAMFIPLSSVAGRLSGGWLGDIFSRSYALVASFLLQSLGLFFLFYGHEAWQLVLFIILFGPAFGSANVLRSAIVRECFGRRAFGSIQGLIITFMAVGGIIGPAFAGFVFDVRGSYQPAWLTFSVATLIGGGVALVMGKSLKAHHLPGLQVTSSKPPD